MKDAAIPLTGASFDKPLQSQIDPSHRISVDDETAMRPLEQLTEYYRRQCRLLFRAPTKWGDGSIRS